MKAPDSDSVSVPVTDSPSPISDWARDRTRLPAVMLHEDALPFRRALRERLVAGAGSDEEPEGT